MTTHNWRENNVQSSDDSVWDKEADPILEGKLVKIEHNIGPNESTMYTIEKDNGEEVKVWGSTVLDDRFMGVSVNTYVKVTYEGKAKSKKGTYYHNYKVFIDEDSVPQDIEERGDDSGKYETPDPEMPPDFLQDEL